jgi:hypothetical protein
MGNVLDDSQLGHVARGPGAAAQPRLLSAPLPDGCILLDAAGARGGVFDGSGSCGIATGVLPLPQSPTGD